MLPKWNTCPVDNELVAQITAATDRDEKVEGFELKVGVVRETPAVEILIWCPTAQARQGSGMGMTLSLNDALQVANCLLEAVIRAKTFHPHAAKYVRSTALIHGDWKFAEHPFAQRLLVDYHIDLTTLKKPLNGRQIRMSVPGSTLDLSPNAARALISGLQDALELTGAGTGAAEQAFDNGGPPDTFDPKKAHPSGRVRTDEEFAADQQKARAIRNRGTELTIRALENEVRELREMMNTKYWEGIRAENEALEVKIAAVRKCERAIADYCARLREACDLFQKNSADSVEVDEKVRKLTAALEKIHNHEWTDGIQAIFFAKTIASEALGAQPKWNGIVSEQNT